MKTRTKVILGIGVVAVIGIGAAIVLKGRRGGGVEVTADQVRKEDVIATVLANGKIQPRRKVDVSANIPGQIINLAVREGEVVEKGDFLLQIDQAQYQASTRSNEANLQSLLHDRDAAEASLEQARYDWETARKSYDEGLIPEADFKRARSAFDSAQASLSAAKERVEQARATLEGARDTLNKTTIRAPLGGVITSLPVHEGEVAVIGTMNNPGTVLMTISDLSEIDADLAVDETDVPRLSVGQTATLTVEAYAEQDFKGIVREVGSSPIQPGSDAATRTGTTTTEAIDFEVKVTMEQPPEGIRPGFSVTAEIETGRVLGVPVVALQALVTREKPREEGEQPARGESRVQEGVYALREGKAVFVPVETGLTGALKIEVKSGLEEGETIITGPFRALRELKDGAEVRVAKEKAEGGKGGSEQ